MNALRALFLMSFALLAVVAAPQTANAASATQINADANATLQSFVAQIVSGTLTAPFIAVVLTLLYFRLRTAKEPAATPEPAAPA